MLALVKQRLAAVRICSLVRRFSFTIGFSYLFVDATIKEAIAEEQRMASRFLNDTEIAKAQRDFELKKAAYDVEVQTKKAEAEMAYELQAAKTKQRIKEEQMQIKVIERTQEIAVQDQEMVRRERELEATVHRPAAAEKYRLEKIAEANRNRVILEAEAEAESVRKLFFAFTAEVNVENANKDNSSPWNKGVTIYSFGPELSAFVFPIFTSDFLDGTAPYKLIFQIKIRGEAEAFAIAAKAKAQAEQMAKKSDAFREYREAAMVDMLLEALPKVSKLF